MSDPIYIKVTDGEFQNCSGYIKRINTATPSNVKYICIIYKDKIPHERTLNKSH